MTHQIGAPLVLAITVLIASGCQSPYYADRGAGLGALAGAGAGAIIGDATGGNAASGALIGAGLGAVTGGVVGSGMDEMQARNRAEIAAQMGRQVPAGAATIDEVVAMSRSGVDPMLIQNYVRSSGMARPLASSDLIYLHNQGVSRDVIQVMQSPPVPPPTIIAQGPPPVIVEEHYYGPPMWHPHFGYRHCYPHHHGPHTSFGISVVK
jgi:Glycine zipper